MLQILQHTPVWVFGLLIGLLFLGYSQTKTRLLSIKRLIILPVVMLVLSALGIASSFGLQIQSLATWGLGIGVALGLNMWISSPRGATYSADDKQFRVPGSWLPMVMILVIFFTKYLVGVLLALHPQTVHTPVFAISACLLFGLSSGFFLARALKVYQTSTQRME